MIRVFAALELEDFERSWWSLLAFAKLHVAARTKAQRWVEDLDLENALVECFWSCFVYL